MDVRDAGICVPWHGGLELNGLGEQRLCKICSAVHGAHDVGECHRQSWRRNKSAEAKQHGRVFLRRSPGHKKSNAIRRTLCHHPLEMSEDVCHLALIIFLLFSDSLGAVLFSKRHLLSILFFQTRQLVLQLRTLLGRQAVLPRRLALITGLRGQEKHSSTATLVRSGCMHKVVQEVILLPGVLPTPGLEFPLPILTGIALFARRLLVQL
mmetsp:Transcript_116837/g.261134  ORF Transcript_116837/g.261134 Transcript_116837/m.261134 type:complete len:209 (+) Transcript_116837:52-678(+)